VINVVWAVNARCLVEVESLATGIDSSKVDVLIAAMGRHRGEHDRAGVASSWFCICDSEYGESRDDCSFGEHLGGLSEDCLV